MLRPLLGTPGGSGHDYRDARVLKGLEEVKRWVGAFPLWLLYLDVSSLYYAFRQTGPTHCLEPLRMQLYILTQLIRQNSSPLGGSLIVRDRYRRWGLSDIGGGHIRRGRGGTVGCRLEQHTSCHWLSVHPGCHPTSGIEYLLWYYNTPGGTGKRIVAGLGRPWWALMNRLINVGSTTAG